MLGVDYTTTQEIVPALCYATTSLVPPSPAQHPPPIPSVLRTLRVGTRFARSWFTYLGVDPKPTIQRTKWIVWRCPARHQCCSQCGVEILQGPRGVLLRAATNRPSTRGHEPSFHARPRTVLPRAATGRPSTRGTGRPVALRIVAASTITHSTPPAEALSRNLWPTW